MSWLLAASLASLLPATRVSPTGSRPLAALATTGNVRRDAATRVDLRRRSHNAFGYGLLAERAPLLVDTRNAMGAFSEFKGERRVRA